MAFGSLQETLYASTAIGASLASFTTEAQLNTTATMGAQAKIPADFWAPSPTNVGRALRITARGILSSTGTPTFTLTVRAGAAGNTSSAILLGTSTLATISGAASAFWELQGDVVLTALGAAGTNSVVRGIGRVSSPGLGTPIAAAWGGAASPGTATTVDTTITNFINVNAACSANSASNVIVLHQFILEALN